MEPNQPYYCPVALDYQQDPEQRQEQQSHEYPPQPSQNWSAPLEHQGCISEMSANRPPPPAPSPSFGSQHHAARQNQTPQPQPQPQHRRQQLHQYQRELVPTIDPQLQQEPNILHPVSPHDFRPLPPHSQCTNATTTAAAVGAGGPTLQTHISGPTAITTTTSSGESPQPQSLLEFAYSPSHYQQALLQHYQEQYHGPIVSPTHPYTYSQPESNDPQHLQQQLRQQQRQQRQQQQRQQQQQQQQQQQDQHLYYQQQQLQQLRQHQQLVHHVSQRPVHASLLPMPSPQPAQSTQQHLTRLSPDALAANGSGMVEVGGRVLLPSGESAASSPSSDAEGSVSPAAAPSQLQSASKRKGKDVGYVPGATSNITPKKNKDGKFPCGECSKTYLHAKHLKRHMLRHTGIRPYECGLCGDNFSRSDILKRHFAKCSARRGNPLGVTHLTLTHAQQKAKAAEKEREKAAAAAAAAGAGSNGGARVRAGSVEGKKGSGGKACDNCVKLKVKCDVGNPCSRCSTKNSSCTYTKNHVQPRGRRSSTSEESIFPLQSSGFGDDGSAVLDETTGYGEGFNFPPPTHPNAHMARQGFQQIIPMNQQQQQEHQQSISMDQQQQEHQQSMITNQQQQQERLEQHIPTSTSIVSGELPVLKLNEHLQSQPHFTPGGTNGDHVTNRPTTRGLDPVVDWHGLIAPIYVDNTYFAQPSLGSSTHDTIGDGIDTLLFTYPPNQYRPMEPGSTFWPPDTDTYVQQLDTSTHVNQMREKCDHVIAFCFAEHPVGSSMSDRDHEDHSRTNTDDLRAWFTPELLEHFVSLFFHHFEKHFPMIHVPTFDIGKTHVGLLSVLICIGAVYSNRGITVGQVRRLCDRVYVAMANHVSPATEPGVSSMVELEDIQALMLLHILLTWHGTDKQRRVAREKYNSVLSLARQMKLFRVLDENELREECSRPGNEYYRQLPDLDFHPEGSVSWSWLSWVTQERRNRCAHILYLLSSAYLIYFNSPPRVEDQEVDLPLPSDDAAWEAGEASICAAALGIFGDQRSREVNASGTRTPTQMRFLDAMRRLMSPESMFPPGSTNAASKFFLIHALHIQIWLYHMRSERDWMLRSQWLGPDPNPPLGHNEVETLDRALEKWKAVWDTDFLDQYPDPNERVGFSRDGTPYYFIGKWFLQYTDRRQIGFGPEGEPRNIKITLGLLQKAKQMPPGSQLELGAVGSIDDKYGIEELTFDMKLLFKPIN